MLGRNLRPPASSGKNMQTHVTAAGGILKSVCAPSDPYRPTDVISISEKGPFGEALIFRGGAFL